MEKCQILIVDDERTHLYLIRKALAKEGDYRLFTTIDPEEAAGILRSQPVDVVIADQHMPQKNGFELLQETKEIAPSAVRIIITGYPEDKKIRRSFQAGLIHQFVAKPWEAEALRITLKNSLEQHQLRREKERLLNELQQKTGRSNHQPEEEDKLNKLKREFMMIANHELRTPATIIKSSLDILAFQNDNLNSTQQKFIANARGGAERLSELLEQFQGILGYDRKNSSQGWQVININELLRAVISQLEECCLQRNISIDMECEDHLHFSGDPEKIRRVFENLFSNAIKYTRDGGRIVVQASLVRGEIRLSIKDSGIGIPANELNNIFKSFYQLGNAEHHHSSKFSFLGGGAGLGLSYCKQIIEAHSGKIRVESQGENQGSTCYITLPSVTEQSVSERRVKEFSTRVFGV